MPKNRTPEAAMKAALDRLRNEGIGVARPSPHQLKSGDLSFYPSTGTIFRDGQPKKLAARGIDAFIVLIRPQHRARKQRAAERPRAAGSAQPDGQHEPGPGQVLDLGDILDEASASEKS